MDKDQIAQFARAQTAESFPRSEPQAIVNRPKTSDAISGQLSSQMPGGYNSIVNEPAKPPSTRHSVEPVELHQLEIFLRGLPEALGFLPITPSSTLRDLRHAVKNSKMELPFRFQFAYSDGIQIEPSQEPKLLAFSFLPSILLYPKSTKHKSGKKDDPKKVLKHAKDEVKELQKKNRTKLSVNSRKEKLDQSLFSSGAFRHKFKEAFEEAARAAAERDTLASRPLSPVPVAGSPLLATTLRNSMFLRSSKTDQQFFQEDAAVQPKSEETKGLITKAPDKSSSFAIGLESLEGPSWPVSLVEDFRYTELEELAVKFSDIMERKFRDSRREVEGMASVNALKIQTRLARGPQGRESFRRIHKQKHGAALSVQCAYRQHRARVRVERRRLEEKSAIAIQCASRQRQARAELTTRRVKKAAAIKIQKTARRFIARRVVERMRKERDAATLIQSVIRRWLAKIRVDGMRKTKSAIKIQCAVRQRQAKKEMEYRRTVKQASTEIQCAIRGFSAKHELEWRRKRRDAACTIQCCERSHRARGVACKKRKERDSAIEIQCLVRCYDACNVVKEKKRQKKSCNKAAGY